MGSVKKKRSLNLFLHTPANNDGAQTGLCWISVCVRAHISNLAKISAGTNILLLGRQTAFEDFHCVGSVRDMMCRNGQFEVMPGWMVSETVSPQGSAPFFPHCWTQGCSVRAATSPAR